jgi:sensor histidine kinase YesM
MLTRLADLYRLILDASKEPLVPLNVELKIVDHYLALQKMRFNERLQYTLQAPANTENIHVPCMMIQTLVENAVKHGIAKSREGGRINVTIQPINDDFYECQVINSGAPLSGSGNGTGIENTIKRLELLYGPDHQFKLERGSETTIAKFFFTGRKA